MKINMFTNKAFTLVELLVVILIIGILAAIAVPQYQYAVLKSKYHTLMNMAKAVKNAQEVYFLQNGKYAEHLSELDISVASEANIAIRDIKQSNGSFAPMETASINNGEILIATIPTQALSFLRKNNDSYMDYNLRLDKAAIWEEKNALCVAWEKSGDMGKKLCKDLSKFPETCKTSGIRYTCRLF